MIPRLIYLWWLSMIGPNVEADMTATCRTAGYARNEALYLCHLDLDGQCAGRDLGPVTDMSSGGAQCDEDRDGIATCTVHCFGTCSTR